MRKILRSAVAAACLVGVSSTLSAEGHFYWGADYALRFLDEDRFIDQVDPSDIGSGFGTNFGYELGNERVAFEGNLGTDGGGELGDYFGAAVYGFFGDRRERLSPYLVAGLTYADPDDESQDLLIQDTTAVQFGVGLARYISDRFEFRGDISGYRVVDVVDAPNENLFDYGVNLALNYHFGDRQPAKPAAKVEPAPAKVIPVREPEPEPEPQVRTITINLAVEFDFDKDVVKSIYSDELQEVADAMLAHKEIQLALEGHTDSRGNAEYNRDLSQRRVTNVKAKLVEDYGIDASRITAKGFGESAPIESNDTDEGRARNRRVVGIVTWEETF